MQQNQPLMNFSFTVFKFHTWDLIDQSLMLARRSFFEQLKDFELMLTFHTMSASFEKRALHFFLHLDSVTSP